MKASAGRVLIIVQNLPVPFDRRVWLEAQTLRDHGLSVSIICPKSKEFNKSRETIDGIRIYRYGMPIEARGAAGYFFEFAYAWLRTAVLSLIIWAREGFDVIQACNPPDTYWLLGLFYRFFGKRFVFDHHDLSPEMFDAKYGGRGRMLRRMLLLLERMTFRTADIVLCTNDSYRRIAIERGGKDPQDVYVVRTGPDLNRLQPCRPEPELKNGREHLVCYLGEMCPQDGVDRLLHAVHHYVRDLGRRDAQFILIGGGPAVPALKEMTRRMELEEFVRFTGRVSDEELCRILSTADVCVDPDPWSEWANLSTMNKILEYMTFGKPIVAFDLLEHRRSAEEAAVYVRPDDVRAFARAVAELLDDPERRRAMGTFGYQRIRKQLSWTHTSRALIAAYYRLFPRMMSADEAERNVLDWLMEKIQANAVDELVLQGEGPLYCLPADNDDGLLRAVEVLLSADVHEGV